MNRATNNTTKGQTMKRELLIDGMRTLAEAEALVRALAEATQGVTFAIEADGYKYGSLPDGDTHSIYAVPCPTGKKLSYILGYIDGHMGQGLS